MKLTEAILKKIINEVLEEGMKTLADLPEGVFIKIASFSDEDGMPVIDIFYADEEGVEMDFGNSSMPYGEMRIDIKPHLADEFPCLDAMMVAHSSTAIGWGPLLYDVAIEVATIMAGGLVSDRSMVSSSAYKVWDFYQNRRTDVKKIQLDNPEGELTPDKKEDDCLQSIADYYAEKTKIPWNKSPLSKLYRKEPTTLRDLQDGGKLINDLNLNF